jgi:hypothetical protein
LGSVGTGEAVLTVRVHGQSGQVPALERRLAQVQPGHYYCCCCCCYYYYYIIII